MTTAEIHKRAQLNRDCGLAADAAMIDALADVLEALKKAKQIIHVWHGDVAWEIYDRASPEMKPINEALARVEALKL